MARQRKRRRLRLAPIVMIAIAANLMIGYFWGGLISLNRVRAIGVLSPQMAQIREIVQRQANRPLSKIDPFAVESSVQRMPGIRYAKLEWNVFGRGRLQVWYRQPIARVTPEGMTLDQTGTVCLTQPSSSAASTSVSIPAGATTINLAWQRPVDLSGLVQVVKQTRSTWPEFRGTIALNSDGFLCLNYSGLGRVNLGGSDSLEAKFQRLQELLSARKELFQNDNEITLTDPDHPVYKPLRTPHENIHPANIRKGQLADTSKLPIARAGSHDVHSMGHQGKSADPALAARR